MINKNTVASKLPLISREALRVLLSISNEKDYVEDNYEELQNITDKLQECLCTHFGVCCPERLWDNMMPQVSVYKLSKKERLVYDRVIAGMSLREIENDLDIEKSPLFTIMKNILKTFGLEQEGRTPIMETLRRVHAERNKNEVGSFVGYKKGTRYDK